MMGPMHPDQSASRFGTSTEIAAVIISNYFYRSVAKWIITQP